MDDHQNQGEQPEQSQEQPTQDSGLQTPQPDQPAPTEAERQEQHQEQAPDAEQAAQPTPVEPTPVARTNEEQEAAANARETELSQQRQEHNERTGGGEAS